MIGLTDGILARTLVRSASLHTAVTMPNLGRVFVDVSSERQRGESLAEVPRNAYLVRPPQPKWSAPDHRLKFPWAALELRRGAGVVRVAVCCSADNARETGSAEPSLTAAHNASQARPTTQQLTIRNAIEPNLPPTSKEKNPADRQWRRLSLQQPCSDCRSIRQSLRLRRANIRG
jgi:hypothetical protein